MIIISDVHGSWATLEKLLAQLPKDEKLCFVGDLIDRGPDSKKVLDFVLDNNHDCIMGNHEEMFLEDISMWKANGGDITYMDIELKKGNSEKNCNYYRDLIKLKFPFYKIYPDIKINNKTLLVCHAGLAYEDLQKNITTGMINWLRPIEDLNAPDGYSYENFLKHPIYFYVGGHTPINKPYICSDFAQIDTGAVFGNELTALEVPSLKIYKQSYVG